MRILLLGSQGNLGTAFTALSKENPDIECIGWDKSEIDVTDRTLLEKKMATLKPDAIINTVAFNDVDGAEKEEEKKLIAEKLNVELVRTLGEISIEFNCVLVHYSSDYVFKGDVQGGYSEDAETSPLNAYGESKVRGEQELIKLSGRGLHWYLIRTARLFGPKGSGPSAKPSFFEIMMGLAKQGQPLKVVSDERGSFTYTPDLAQATLDLLLSGDNFGIYHLVNDGEASWYDAARCFFKSRGMEVPIEPVPGTSFARAAQRPVFSRLRNTKRPALRSWQAAIDEYAKGV